MTHIKLRFPVLHVVPINKIYVKEKTVCNTVTCTAFIYQINNHNLAMNYLMDKRVHKVLSELC